MVIDRAASMPSHKVHRTVVHTHTYEALFRTCHYPLAEISEAIPYSSTRSFQNFPEIKANRLDDHLTHQTSPLSAVFALECDPRREHITNCRVRRK